MKVDLDTVSEDREVFQISILRQISLPKRRELLERLGKMAKIKREQGFNSVECQGKDGSFLENGPIFRKGLLQMERESKKKKVLPVRKFPSKDLQGSNR